MLEQAGPSRISHVVVAAVVAAALMVACTKPNPDYEPPIDSPCKPGERRCDDDFVLVCIPVTDGDPVWALERSCPSDGPCVEDRCDPLTRRPCSRGCDAGQECTVFVSANGSRLELLCAEPVGTADGMQPCQDSRGCRSGLCMAIWGRRLCFLACREDGVWSPCPSGHECRDLTVTIDGVQDTIRGCIPEGDS